MPEAADILRDSRRAAGLTQAQLAERIDTTQTAIARLERRGANPTIATLTRAIAATGHRLSLAAEPVGADIDEDQLRAHLRMTPTERVRAHAAAYAGTAQLMHGLRR